MRSGFFFTVAFVALVNVLSVFANPVPVATGTASSSGTFSLEAIRKPRRVTGTVGASGLDIASGEWHSPVQIGTPPQTLSLTIDSGSWDCVVLTTQSNSSQYPAGTVVYDPAKSRTSQFLKGYSFTILYGTGRNKVTGDVFRDTVSIGGITSPAQAVESALNFTSTFGNSGGGGIIGMAFSKNNTVRPIKQKTFFDNVKDQLAQPIFTANLYLVKAGSFDFGFIDSAKIDEPVTWTPVDTNDDQQGWWSITVQAYQVGSTAIVSAPFHAIVDTGATHLFFQSSVVQAYYAQVPGATDSAQFGGFVFPCAGNEVLPDLHLVISGKSFVVPGDQLNLGPVAGGDGSTCLGNIQAVPPPAVPGLPEPTAVLGVTFMLRYLVAFDMGSLQVGFALKKYIENATFADLAD